jgi:hypothetical protein
MSKIKELKTNTDYNLNLVSVLELFSPEGKSKYTETLLRLMKNTPNLKEHSKEIRMIINNQFPFISMEILNQHSDIQMMMIYKFIDGFFNMEDLNKYRKFCEYNERNLIEQNDLTTYKSFDQLISAMSIAEMKAEEKELENQVIKIYEDSVWLLLRPLTFNASKKYGANTKWCTTQENNPEYFHKYTKKGVLIYCIDKKSGYKVASFYSLDKGDPEFSYWNQKDTRIDSTDSELTIELIGFIREYVKDKKVKTNHFMLTDEQRNVEDGGKKSNRRSGAISDRVANAVRRAQEEMVEESEPQELPQPELPFDTSNNFLGTSHTSQSLNMDTTQEIPESSIDRMMWSSSTTTSETE